MSTALSKIITEFCKIKLTLGLTRTASKNSIYLKKGNASSRKEIYIQKMKMLNDDLKLNLSKAKKKTNEALSQSIQDEQVDLVLKLTNTKDRNNFKQLKATRVISEMVTDVVNLSPQKKKSKTLLSSKLNESGKNKKNGGKKDKAIHDPENKKGKTKTDKKGLGRKSKHDVGKTSKSKLDLKVKRSLKLNLKEIGSLQKFSSVRRSLNQPSGDIKTFLDKNRNSRTKRSPQKIQRQTPGIITYPVYKKSTKLEKKTKSGKKSAGNLKQHGKTPKKNETNGNQTKQRDTPNKTITNTNKNGITYKTDPHKANNGKEDEEKPPRKNSKTLEKGHYIKDNKPNNETEEDNSKAQIKRGNSGLGMRKKFGLGKVKDSANKKRVTSIGKKMKQKREEEKKKLKAIYNLGPERNLKRKVAKKKNFSLNLNDFKNKIMKDYHINADKIVASIENNLIKGKAKHDKRQGVQEKEPKKVSPLTKYKEPPTDEPDFDYDRGDNLEPETRKDKEDKPDALVRSQKLESQGTKRASSFKSRNKSAFGGRNKNPYRRGNTIGGTKGGYASKLGQPVNRQTNRNRRETAKNQKSNRKNSHKKGYLSKEMQRFQSNVVPSNRDLDGKSPEDDTQKTQTNEFQNETTKDSVGSGNKRLSENKESVKNQRRENSTKGFIRRKKSSLSRSVHKRGNNNSRKKINDAVPNRKKNTSISNFNHIRKIDQKERKRAVSVTQSVSNISLTQLEKKGLRKQKNIVEFIKIREMGLPPFTKARTVLKKFGIIEAFIVNTNKGCVRTSNEDRVSILLNAQHKFRKATRKMNNCALFSVFDGHGGTDCCNFLKENLHNKILADLDIHSDFDNSMKKIFNEIDSTYLKRAIKKKQNYSGSCANCLFVLDEEIVVVNTGDSRTICSKKGGQVIEAMSVDHKPGYFSEFSRVITNGGQLYRVSSNLKTIENMFYTVTNYSDVLQIDEIEKTNRNLCFGPWRVKPGGLSVSR